MVDQVLVKLGVVEQAELDVADPPGDPLAEPSLVALGWSESCHSR